MTTAPDYIQFYPTLRCNRTCEFCFNRTMPAVPDMSPRSFSRMLDTVRAPGVKTIDIIGGEPTMHDDIVSLVRNAVSRGFRVNLSSNGTNPGRLGELSRLGGRVTVGISINDRVTLEGLREFIKHYGPVVKTVFHPGMDSSLIDDIRALPAGKFYLIYRDAMERDGLSATIPFYRFLDSVEGLSDSASLGTVYCSGFLPDAASHPELAKVRCPAGTTKLGVMPDGSVYPCNLFFGRSEFLLGNILEESLEAVWRHPALAFFRAFDGNRCPDTSCSLHAACHGGCPAHSLIHGGALAAPEPRCVTRGRDNLL